MTEQPTVRRIAPGVSGRDLSDVKPTRSMTCGNCGATGHNARGCKRAKPVMAKKRAKPAVAPQPDSTTARGRLLRLTAAVTNYEIAERELMAACEAFTTRGTR